MNETSEVKYQSPRDVLIAARKLIEKPENWTQGLYARYANNRPAVSIYDPTACKFCVMGAIMRVSKSRRTSHWPALDALTKAVGRDPMSFNDDMQRTHAEVLAAFDRAIEAAGA